MSEYRLGDIIDDYCVRCKRIMNHAVVSVMNNEPAKVRCRTCHSDHDYRHELAPPPKVDPRKQALFNEVLKKVDPGAEPAEGSPAEGQPNETQTGEAQPAEEAAPAAEAPKVKAKGRGRK